MKQKQKSFYSDTASQCACNREESSLIASVNGFSMGIEPKWMLPNTFNL